MRKTVNVICSNCGKVFEIPIGGLINTGVPPSDICYECQMKGIKRVFDNILRKQKR